MGYLHVQIICEQASKKNGKPCGDMYEVLRTDSSTVLIFCDGLGSGIKANLSANLCSSRIKQLLISGFSLRQTFDKVVNTMEEAKTKDLPYSVFTMAKIQSDGTATILSYEMPLPVFVSQRYATILEHKTIQKGTVLLSETNCFIKKNEGLLFVSDGVTYSGIGGKLKNGWGIDGLKKFSNEYLNDAGLLTSLPKDVLKMSQDNWGDKIGDDCTVILARCTPGLIVNILTGTPVKKQNDSQIVSRFLSFNGTKIVCGASTAKMVARETSKNLEMNTSFSSQIAPPNYEIEGIDLVTEGAITLNQLYNVWDQDYKKLEKGSPVTELYDLLKTADRVNLFVGNSHNVASDDISFKQTGILSRRKIIPLLKRILEDDGKLVHIEYC